MEINLDNSLFKAEQKRAPIALFVYNRPIHTRRTVQCLEKNEGAQESVLYIFSDAEKSVSDKSSVEEVRKFIHEITGFKQVFIIEQTENLGLARSIINGVTCLCEKHGSVIVLEDDLETSPYFLNFMNEALGFYENTTEVMHISGCRYPAEPFGKDDTFFLQVPLCWGWATWQRAWITFDKNISVMNRFNRTMIKRFDFDNTYSYWKQLELNRTGKLNTWFVFWYANLFLRGGLSLFPARSLVSNIGFDSSGENCGSNSDFIFKLSETPVKVAPIPIVNSSTGFELHKKFFRKVNPKLIGKILRKISRLATRIGHMN